MKGDPVIDWLLQEDNPPVRLLTLTRLLHRPETDGEVKAARARLMDYSVTQAILAHGEQFWPDDKGAYQKYRGKYWQVIFLGQFLADGQDPRIAVGVEHLLASRSWVHRWGGGQCLTANLLTAFRRLGYGDHPVVQEESEGLAEQMLADGGIDCEVMTYSLLPRCYMTLPKLLFCFGEVPAAQRSAPQQAAIEWIARTLVDHRVYVYVPGNRKAWQQEVLAQAPKRADLPPGYPTVKDWVASQGERFRTEHGLGKLEPKRGWTQFGFPLNYNSDVLETMLALAGAGVVKSAPLKEPLQLIRDKRTADGVWCLDNSFNGKMWADVEVKGQPSKWITLFARIVLDHFGAL